MLQAEAELQSYPSIYSDTKSAIVIRILNQKNNAHELSGPCWTVTISEYAMVPVESFTEKVLYGDSYKMNKRNT